MKKLKNYAPVFILSLLIFIGSAKKTLADLMSPGDLAKIIGPKDIEESKSFFDLIQTQHIIIGFAVILIVSISFLYLFKNRNKQ